jgi:hypothetical protein
MPLKYDDQKILSWRYRWSGLVAIAIGNSIEIVFVISCSVSMVSFVVSLFLSRVSVP